jgi:hypothetical protein
MNYDRGSCLFQQQVSWTEAGLEDAIKVGVRLQLLLGCGSSNTIVAFVHFSSSLPGQRQAWRTPSRWAHAAAHIVLVWLIK